MYGRHRFSSPGGLGGVPGLTPTVQRLMIANGLVFVAQMVGRGGIEHFGAISVEGMLRGCLWQPFTYMWLHASPMHLIFNMFALWMFGGQLEMARGSRWFLRFYLTCGVGAGIVILIWNSLTLDHYVPTLGASGAVYGVLTAFSLLWPDRTIMLIFPPIPMRAIWFIPFLFLMQIATGGGENISHAGHLGGVLVAIWLLRDEFRRVAGFSSLRYRWHRWRMRNRLRAVRREDLDRRKRDDDDQDRPTYH
jgi:membrane associated rhomboid family serine protease